MIDYYVYVYLDPRKIGDFSYGEEFKFENEPFYIGKGRNDRKYHHLNMAKGSKKVTSNKHLIYKIKNILQEGLVPIIVEYKNSMDNDSALKMENKMVLSIGRKDLNLGPLTNLCDGGERQNYNLSQETKDKISSTLKGKVTWNIGRKHTNEAKRNMHKFPQNHIPWNKGKTGVYSGQHLAAMKNRVVSTETREKISKANKGKVNPNKGRKYGHVAWNRKIYKFLLNNEIVTIENMCEFCKENNLTPSIMYSIINEKRKTYKGYSKYYD